MGCKHDELARGALFAKEIADTVIFHQLALILSAIFMCLAVSISFWLILDHALHYLRPYEQKHIIRILAMIPIYAVISFLSLLFYQASVQLELLRNCYEAYVIASFFTLLCHYIAPTLHEQKDYFRNIQPKRWVFPLKRVKTPRSGLTWFNIIYACVFQFCFTRPLFTIIAAIAQTQDRYCASSTQPENGHIWIALLQGACVLTAMYCLIQFYTQLKEDLVPHKPFLKVLCIKLAMFLCFWQTWFLSLLSVKKGPLQPTFYVAALDIHIGIPCILVCFEMMLFACVSHWAFPWRPYDLDHQLRGPNRLEHYACGPHVALLDALNPWDYAKAAARGFRWLFHGVRHRRDDVSYQVGLDVKVEVEVEKDAKVDVEPASSTYESCTSALSDPELSRRMRGRHGGGKKSRHTIG
ncbi:DUF300-domain-containing protein [Ophiobolus disseminans]|uniref:DUF300-domain-containing protein n=1 Tax=Ophiobolus disseminans TaxID=1469910 RepID=A0A6A6ZKA6_9PLEO|nr:DUF300-domain-containing protein [Ophiobolus disseminans]